MNSIGCAPKAMTKPSIAREFDRRAKEISTLREQLAEAEKERDHVTFQLKEIRAQQKEDFQRAANAEQRVFAEDVRLQNNDRVHFALHKILAAIVSRQGGEIEIRPGEMPDTPGTVHIWVDQKSGNLKVAYTQ